MRLFFPSLLGGFLIVGLMTGCSKEKPADDGSGSRAMPKQFSAPQKNKKSDKPPMDPSRFPPTPPPPPKQ